MKPIQARLVEAIKDSGRTVPELIRLGVASQQVLSNWQSPKGLDPAASSVARAVEKLGLNGHYILTGERGGQGQADFLAGIRAACRIYSELCVAISTASDEVRVHAAIEGIEAELREIRRQLPPESLPSAGEG